MGSDWASAQIFARRAAILAESRISSIAVSGMEGKVHLSIVASMRSLAFSRHCRFCSCDNVVGGGGVYSGGWLADRRTSIGDSSEEWLMLCFGSGDNRDDVSGVGRWEDLLCSGSCRCGLGL